MNFRGETKVEAFNDELYQVRLYKQKRYYKNVSVFFLAKRQKMCLAMTLNFISCWPSLVWFYKCLTYHISLKKHYIPVVFLI